MLHDAPPTMAASPPIEPPNPLSPEGWLSALLAYGGLGLPIFPIHPGTKRPARRGWQRTASDDPHRILSLFADCPNYNAGLLMGLEIRPGEFAFALDVDPRNGGDDSLDGLLMELGLSGFAPTAEALTGSGGSHIVMTAPFPPKSLANAFGPDYPGLDIKGRGGYIVAWPSIHAGTGEPYTWLRHPAAGIAPAPRALVERLPRRESPRASIPSRVTVPARTPRKSDHEPGTRPPSGLGDGAGMRVDCPDSRPADPRPPGADRAGDIEALTREMIDRFPVPGPGHRHDQMTRMVASLVGRGYDDETIRRAHDRWHDAFAADRRSRTGREAAREELEESLRITKANPEFACAIGQTDHLAACRSMALPDEVLRAIRSGTFDPAQMAVAPVEFGGPADPNSSQIYLRDSNQSPRKPRRAGSSKTVSGSSDRAMLRPLRDRSIAYVEAILIHGLHKVEIGEYARDGVIRMTDRQVREIAAARHPEIGWSSNQQTERLKSQFIGRPGDGKPARRRELLREVRKGRPASGGAAGTPSEYLVTGLRPLLDRVLDLESGIRANEAA